MVKRLHALLLLVLFLVPLAALALLSVVHTESASLTAMLSILALAGAASLNSTVQQMIARLRMRALPRCRAGDFLTLSSGKSGTVIAVDPFDVTLRDDDGTIHRAAITTVLTDTITIGRPPPPVAPIQPEEKTV